MSFDTESRHISDIFSRVAKYSVPRYQRDYVWDKVNWAELLNDIIFTVKYSDANWTHFLGAIVLIDQTEQNKSKPNHVFNGINEYDIIDGQQRLTTIYILLLCLYYRLLNINTEASKNRANYIQETYLTAPTVNGTREFKIYNETYETDIRNLYQCVIDNESIPEENSFYRVFSYFNNELISYGFENLVTFSEKLLAINIVEIISTQEEEIYNIFEVLNARGRKLKQMELLKNHVMKYVQPRTTDVVDKAKNKWSQILSNCANSVDEDIMLAHFCKCYIKKRADNSDMVYKLIKEEIPIENLSDFLGDLVEYSGAYAIIASNNGDVDIEFFDIKRNTQVRSLLAAIQVLKKRELITDESLRTCFHNLRNFFFLFQACSYSSNKTDATISNAAFEVYHAKSEIDFKYIMSNMFLDLSKLITQSTVEELMFTTSSMHYSLKNSTYKSNHRIVKYILYCLYQPDQRDTILDQNKLTIEHLLNDDGSLRNSVIYNLTLTSGEINSNELKNRPLSEKVNILKTQSSVIANQQLDNYLDDQGNYLEEKRKKDFKEKTINHVFKYEESPFEYTKEMVSSYLKMKHVLQHDEELLNILFEKGMNIQVFLANNPAMKDAYDRFVSICGFTSH